VATLLTIGLNPSPTRFNSAAALPKHAKVVDIATSIIGQSTSAQALGYEKNSPSAQAPSTPLQDAVATVDNYSNREFPRLCPFNYPQLR